MLVTTDKAEIPSIFLDNYENNRLLWVASHDLDLESVTNFTDSDLIRAKNYKLESSSTTTSRRVVLFIYDGLQRG